MDGEMLRYRRSRECLDKDLTPSISTYEYEEDDDCGEFRRTRATIYRTQMFLRPVDVQNSSDITLVTQLNIERFPIFEKLISNWEGPISASIYASDAESFQLTEYWKQSRILSTRRNIAIHSIYKRGNFYPVNYLRNVAINGSKTEYLLLLDVDFLPSQGSHSILQRHLNDFKKQNALILPAFETVNGNSFESMNKNDFLELWAQKRVRPFRQEIWPQGHFATDFEKWKTSEGVYEISYQHDFEPYFLIRKSECPPFDERFVGFGWNKVAHSMVLNKMGYTFRVLPDVFLLHFDHPPSMEMLKFRTSPIYRKCMKMLKGEFVRDLIETALPEESCSYGERCVGDSACIDGICLCVEGMKKLAAQCVEPVVLELAERIALTTSTVAPEKARATTTTPKRQSTPAPTIAPIYWPDKKRPIIGLAGGICGVGGVCRSMTTCQENICVCFWGFKAAFGECVRDHHFGE
ncbi:unnamed protein product, partial [Mesorhabditis belari]|uniref:EB domain-containing protein n=1 Tax=Mesorhabditis belari TaxID=2138241 RepID=A0AAF3FB36_9BILA